MIRRRCRIDRDDDSGWEGLRPLWMTGDPVVGMAVAHDILEHAADGGRLELQALGSIVYVRGLNGYFSNRLRNDPADNIGSEFENLAMLWVGDSLPDPPPSRPIVGEFSDAEEIIQNSVYRGLSFVRSMGLEDSTFLDRGARDRCIGWMRDGFRKSRRRWRKTTPWMVFETFRQIETVVDKFLLRTDVTSYRGLEVTITVDVGRAICHIDEEYDDEY